MIGVRVGFLPKFLYFVELCSRQLGFLLLLFIKLQFFRMSLDVTYAICMMVPDDVSGLGNGNGGREGWVFC